MPSNSSIPVLITGGMPEYTIERIQTPGYAFRHIENPTDAELAQAEVIIGQIPFERLPAAKALRWLQLSFAGADGYAKPGFPEHVLLTNASGVFGRPIAEYAFAAVLSMMRRLHLYRDAQSSAQWEWLGDEMSPAGKHLLILGAGDIGSNTARLFRPFGCKITGVRRVARACPAEFDAMVTLDEAEALLSEADIIICCLPGTELTRKWFSRSRLQKLKENAILVNVGRGSLIDHDALAEILLGKRIFGTVLDVTDPEPLPPEHPLWKCPNALITPHISGKTFSGLSCKEDALFEICRENLSRWLRGERLKNIVDLSTGYRTIEN